MKITEAAANKIKEIMDAQGGGFSGILVGFEGGYKLDLVREEDASSYVEIENPLLGVYAAAEHMKWADQAVIDYITEGATSGFKVERERGEDESLLASEIQDIMEKEINPAIANHGGFIHVLDVEGKRVYVQMGGGCTGCGMANVTLKSGVEARLRELDPDIEVVDITDHAAGTNPYYAPSQK